MAALAQREVIELRIDALLGDVDSLIGQLDRLDGDADLEPEGDDLDGDYGSEDEFMLHTDREGGAGCPLADPGGCQHDGREPEEGV